MTFVFLITTNLFFLASMVVFNINPLYTWPIYALFLLIDGAYLSANLFKFLTGESGFHSRVLHAFHGIEGCIMLGTCWACLISSSDSKSAGMHAAHSNPLIAEELPQAACHASAALLQSSRARAEHSGCRRVVPDSAVSCGLPHQLHLVLRPPAQERVL